MLTGGQGPTGTRELELLKELYFKLQNVEDYPEILPKSRDLLLKMFSETLTDAYDDLESSILSVTYYTKEGLLRFLHARDAEITEQWVEYLAKRRQGMTRQMFQNQNDARLWLKQNAPLRYVDGAWLGHINRTSTPFGLRPITKLAWQVLSEEYGDGDPAKHHVCIYRQLMEDIASDFPPRRLCRPFAPPPWAHRSACLEDCGFPAAYILVPTRISPRDLGI